MKSVAAYRRLRTEAPARAAGILRKLRCVRPRITAPIIEQFGRFPHRNAVLGRACTPAEAEWLQKGGASFGQ